MTTRPIPFEGICIQIYRGAVAGKTHAIRVAWLDARLAELAAVGVSTIAWHGFTQEMNAVVFSEFADLAAHHGLISLAAFGLDATDPKGKGERMAKVAASPHCAGVLVDAEGAYDNNAAEAAIAMGRAFRDGAPDAWVCTQPWPLPGYHSHFPYKEFAAWSDAVAPQFYVQDWKRQYGADAYEKMWPKFEAAWVAHEKNVLGPALTRPRFPSVQGYQQPLDDATTILAKNPTCIVWSEPTPDATFMQALRAVHERRCVVPAA